MAKILLHCKGIFTKTSLFFIGFLLAFSGWAQTEPATVTTDKDDYAPGEYVIITGTGWQPGETVSFHFDETPKPASCLLSHDISVVADADGKIYNDQFLIKINHLGVAFVLTATGQSSGLVATRHFTDALFISPTISGDNLATSANAVYTITILNTNTGNTNAGLGSFKMLVPNGYSVPTVTNITASGERTWINDGYNSTDRLISMKAESQSDELGNGLSISFSVSLVNPSNVGSYTWTTTGYGTRNYQGGSFGITTPPGQPTVVITAACTAPTISSTGTLSAVTYSGSAQTTTLSYTATTNSPTSYSIDWNAAANSAGLPDQGSTNHTFSSGVGSMPSIAVPALLPSGIYSGVVTVRNACGLSGTKNVSLTVNKAPSVTTVTVPAGTYTYTGLAQTPATVTVTGAGGLNLTPTADYVNNTNAGTATARYTYTESANHLASSDSEDFVIDKANAAITVTGYTGTYDAAANGATGTATGVEGETLAGLDLGLSFTNVPGGQADWIFTDVTGNYNDDSGDVQIVIGKADAAITVTGYTGIYDAAAHGATGSATGVEGETLAGFDLGLSFTNVPGGQADWIFTDVTGNYNDDLGDVQIVIGKADAAITVTGYNVTYDAAAHGATGTATGVEGETLAGLDLGLSFTNVPGGQADWIFTDVTGNYNDDSGDVQIVIRKAATTTVVTINGGPFTYTGSAITPATVSVTGAGGLNITPAASYTNNTNAGTATASYDYAGDSNYEPSSDSEDFEIEKATTTTVVTINGGPFSYTGSAIEPATVSVTGAGGLNLTPTADYANNTNAGTAIASYDYAGDSNYEPSSDSEDFEIEKATTTTVVTINGGPFSYTGSAIEPATVSVTGAGGLNLTPTADYANNTNAGTATASYDYAGDSNYEPSSDSEDFEIEKATTTTVVTINGGPFSYTGSAIEPATVTVTGAGGLNLTPTADYANNTNAGTATASYTYAESANHFGSSDSGDFTIGKAASVTVVTVLAGPYTYTGSAQTPATVSVTGAGGLNETPTADYVNNTNAGTATASYTYAESANHFGSSDSEDFIIGKAASVTVVTVPAGPYTYTGSAQTPATVSVTGAGGLNETPAASYTNNVNAGTANASYTYVETANYFGSSDNKDFTIDKKGLSITANDTTKYEGQVNPTFSVTYNGFVNGEDEEDLVGTLVLTTAATVNSCANDYDIVPSGLISGNYAITFVKGTLTVNGVTIDASASSTPVAIGTVATLRATVSPAVAGVSVTFYFDNLVKGTSLTDGTGKAILVVNGLAADVYEIKAIIGSGCSASEVVFLPVYDPAGGFVTGGGWIDSPAGAMTGLKENIVGKANFGFNAKYKTGKNNTSEVDGNTNFQFKAGDLHFSSASHDNIQLVISGAKATYTGTGTVNGVGNHKFRVIAIDGEVSGGGGTDKFRIMIWENNSSSTLLYDNKRGDSESGDDATALGGGSIVIHKPKGNSKAQEDITKGTPIIMEDLKPEILETLAASPNPVVSTSVVRFSVTEDANVILRVYDYSGRLIETLYNGSVKAFENKDVDFDRKNLMSGIYIVKLTTQNGQSYEKRIIVK